MFKGNGTFSMSDTDTATWCVCRFSIWATVLDQTGYSCLFDPEILIFIRLMTNPEYWINPSLFNGPPYWSQIQCLLLNKSWLTFRYQN